MKYLIIFLMFSLNVYAESYLCISEAAGGVSFNEKTFTPAGTSFKTSTKFVVKKENSKWTVNEMGKEKDNQGNCEVYNNRDGSKSAIGCDYEVGKFRMSFDKLKFMRVYEAGWTGPFKVGGQVYNVTPFIEVGSCSEI